jgi:hypothetical protein
MNLFTRPQERPGLQVSRHPMSSSTNETFTFIVFSVMRSTTESSLARIYSDLATKAAAAAIDEELMFTAGKKKDMSHANRWIFKSNVVRFMQYLTRVIQIAMIKSVGKVGIKILQHNSRS